LTSSELRVPVLALLLALLAPALAMAQEPPPEARGRMERRLRMARSLGLAEALDLDEAGTVRLNALMAPFDARRKALLEAVRGDVRTLRQAARRGDPKALAEVEGAVQRVFDARGAVLAIDREMFAALSKGMPPEQVARMALFFAQFRQRFGMELPEPPGGGSR
jgi:hypothetical protein